LHDAQTQIIPKSLPGGTENVAKTAIKKTFAVDADDDDGNVDAAASEGMKKTMDGMCDAMMPLGSGGMKGKGQDDDSDEETAPRRRRGARAVNGGGTPTPKKEDPEAELKKEVSKVIKGSGPMLGTSCITMGSKLNSPCKLSGNLLAQVENSCNPGSRCGRHPASPLWKQGR